MTAGTALNRLETLFPKEMFGCIIGEKGARIKEVREKNGVQINNDKDVTRGGFRAIRYEGDWCAMWNAFCECVKTISEDERAFNNNDINCEKFTVQIKIPKEIAGSVIGKQGSNLKEWRQKWPDCDFTVEEDQADSNQVRYFKMKGHPFTMCEASVSVADVIEIALQKGGNRGDNRGSNRSSGNMQQNNNRRQTMDLSQNKRQSGQDNLSHNLDMMSNGYDQGMGPGGPAGNNPMGNNPMGNNLMGGPGNNMNTSGNGNMGGGGPNSHLSGGLIMGSTSLDSLMGNPFDSNNMGPGPGDDPSTKRRRTTESDGAISLGTTPQTMNCTCQIMVDDSVAAKIIGKSGNVIKGIRTASGCNVNTDRQGDKADGHREIQIIGALPGIQVALSMIQSHLLAHQ